MGLKDVFDSLREVFGKRKYALMALAIAFIFYLLNVLVSSWKQISYFYNTNGFLESAWFFFLLALRLEKTIIQTSFITLVTISILIGVLFSMIAYRTGRLKKVSKKTGFVATAGIFFGVVVPGCVACGLGLISFFGIGAATLNLLPYKGLELSILSIILLAIAILMVSKDIKKGIVCEI